MIEGAGILNPNCKCYTFSTLLVATSNQSYYTNSIPEITIYQDDCCIIELDFFRNGEMGSLKLNYPNSDELRHAQQKLNKFDEILQQNSTNLSSSSNQSGEIFYMEFQLQLQSSSFTYCCCDSRWLPIIERFYQRPDKLANICINSYNTVSYSQIYPTSLQLFNIKRDDTLEDISNTPYQDEPVPPYLRDHVTHY
ncbi:hypothetical protein JTB14_020036 [Gonioctena quinquepunctata]|nr:hypothetical protein JTB14_020036 [Gonioctena quinquepunctata]